MASSYSYIAGVRRQSTPSDLLKSYTPFIRLSLLSLVLISFILINLRQNTSPWLSQTFPLFSSSSSPNSIVTTKTSSSRIKIGTTPPIKGCQDLSKTSLEPRENAAIVLLVREEDLSNLIPTLINFEDRFNKNFRYPYVFISSPDNPPFSLPFIETITTTLPSKAIIEWSTVPEEEWSIPEWLNTDEIQSGFVRQEEEGVQYAGREAYHHMCRFYSGFWARMEVLSKYDWYWRLEPGVEFYCSITYDPFRFLSLNNKIYGFVITIIEDLETIPSLFSTVTQFAKKKGIIPNEDLWEFFTRKKEGEDGVLREEYTACHFWTNFEIGDLRFFRSTEYQELFTALDEAGGFYTERWGDAPIRSLALGLLADVDRIHFFEDFAYKHDNFLHCPSEDSELGCNCNCPKFGEKENVDIDNNYWYSCLPRWKEASAKGRHLDGGG